MPNSELKKWPVITCPHCGYQYAPSEIFMSDELTGRAEQVVRDALGKVIYQDYAEDEEPGQIEHYVCDECGKPFTVEPVISYKVKKEDEALDFSELNSSLLD